MKSMKTVSPWALVLAAAAALVMAAGSQQTAEAVQCDPSCWKQTDNRLYSGVGYPETTSATYWSYTFDSRPGLVLKLSAQFPYARYMAYTLYNLDEGEDRGDPVRVDDAITQHLSDKFITPLEDHINPYVVGNNRSANERSYTIYVVQEESGLIGNPDIKNMLIIPRGIKTVSLFLRVYLSDDARDPQGKVKLPTIEAMDEWTGAEAMCPDARELQSIVQPKDIVDNERLDINAMFLQDDANRIEAYKPGAYGLFPNGDAPYLVVPLVSPNPNPPAFQTVNNSGKVAVLRFKAPSFPDMRGNGQFSDADDVRYWSVCIGDWALTNSNGCIADQDVPRDPEGYVHLLIGPASLIRNAPDWVNLKWTYPDLSYIQRPILIFRQILPRRGTKDAFDGDFDKVPEAFNDSDLLVPLSEIPEWKYASNTIGEYAPVGTYCTMEDFQQNKCGFEGSGSGASDPPDESTGGCGN